MSNLIAGIIALIVVKAFGLPGAAFMFFSLLALHIYYRVINGFWMGDR